MSGHHYPHFPVPVLWQNTPAARWAAFRKAITPQIEAATPPDPFANFYETHEKRIRNYSRKSRAHHNGPPQNQTPVSHPRSKCPLCGQLVCTRPQDVKSHLAKHARVAAGAKPKRPLGKHQS